MAAKSVEYAMNKDGDGTIKQGILTRHFDIVATGNIRYITGKSVKTEEAVQDNFMTATVKRLGSLSGYFADHVCIHW